MVGVIWTRQDLEQIARRRRGEPDVFAAFRTPMRLAGPKPTTVSLFTLPPRDPASFPMPDDDRRTTWQR